MAYKEKSGILHGDHFLPSFLSFFLLSFLSPFLPSFLSSFLEEEEEEEEEEGETRPLYFMQGTHKCSGNALYSKSSLIRWHLIRMSGNPDRNMKNSVHS
jgi:hypothetical protein